MNQVYLGGATPDILVVDDTPENLQVLSGMLKDRGYKVRPALSGKVALQAAKSATPDMVLLDVNMPDINGYEVCSQLKRDERMRDVPIIFISALSETIDKVMAFGVGGVDYITKPFQFEEVEARVAAHLKLRRLQLALEVRNRELQHSNEELRRLQELRDNLTNMIVHDLRSPLTGVVCAVEMIDRESEQLAPASRSMLANARTALDQVIEMINSVLDLGKIEAGELRPVRKLCDLLALARESAASLDMLRGKRKVELLCEETSIPAYIDRDLIARVIQNFLANALKFTEPTGSVQIYIERNEQRLRLSVTDDGPGIATAYHDRIFEKYGQVENNSVRVGTGLGLTFCRLAVKAHGGTTGVVSEPGKGSTFWMELPVDSALVAPR